MKIGLMLGGGGVFGAYQVGVLKVLREENLLDKIEVMSGSSIGAINIVMLMAGLSIEEIEELWAKINNEVIYKGKRPYFRNEIKSLINIGPLYESLSSDISINKIKESKVRGYATLTEVKSPKLKHQLKFMYGHKKHVLLNNSENPFQIAKGSASVPMLFGSTKIKDSYYVDGGAVDNNPMEPLLDESCNLILAIPLATKLNYKKYEHLKITVIDFKYGKSFYKHNSFNIVKSMDFNKKFIHHLQEEGYKWGKEIIRLLRKNHIICDNQFIIDSNEFNYYNLDRLEEE